MSLNRPYIRKDVREEVERRAARNERGQFLDANTGKPIEGQYDLGHKAGHEHWREAEKAEAEGLSQEEFNDRMNNPDLYQIEDPHENRSHVYEDKSQPHGGLEMIEGKNMEAPKEQSELKGFDQQIQEQKEKLSSLEKECDEKIATGKGRSEKEIDKEMRDVGARIDSLYKQKAEQEKKGPTIRR